MAEFQNLKLDEQLDICEQEINYWRRMRKQLIQQRDALTDEEKLAVKAVTDLTLSKKPLKVKKEE